MLPFSVSMTYSMLNIIVYVAFGGYIFCEMGSMWALVLQKKLVARAMNGDRDAGLRVVIPSLCSMFRVYITLCCVLLCSCVVVIVCPASPAKYMTLELLPFCSLVICSVVPLLLSQPSLSYVHVQYTAVLIASWWIVGAVLLGGCWYPFHPIQMTYMNICVPLVTSATPFIMSILVLTGVKRSRVELKSKSSRQCVELVLVFSCAHGACSVGYTQSQKMQYMAVLSLISGLCMAVLPWVTSRALLADTKYWRGLGRNNRGGLVGHDKSSRGRKGSEVEGPGTADTEASRAASTPPDMHQSMHPNVAATQLQTTLGQLRSAIIDFAYVDVQRVMCRGTAATVYHGRYTDPPRAATPVAVKVWSPPDIDEEDLVNMAREVQISMKLSKHPNIVQCFGICVRPPQLALVMENCERGSLGASLVLEKEKWNMLRKISACVDAACAMRYVHSMGFVHRDIKAENFFVMHNWRVKLGDFGESSPAVRESLRSSECGRDSHLSSTDIVLVGSVPYMAPELLRDEPLSELDLMAADIYALGITMWQVWHGGRDPYEGGDTFAIYRAVITGNRPLLSADAPIDMRVLISRCWDTTAQSRPSADAVASALERIWSHSAEAEYTSRSHCVRLKTEETRCVNQVNIGGSQRERSALDNVHSNHSSTDDRNHKSMCNRKSGVGTWPSRIVACTSTKTSSGAAPESTFGDGVDH